MHISPPTENSSDDSLNGALVLSRDELIQAGLSLWAVGPLRT